ncbi:MAG: GHKL domain-containing protein [Eubacterium sp.]|nr:GHKL domain-containing protein [Eubacterium sp.]
MLSLPIGQTACLVYDFIRRDRRLLLTEICIYVGFDAAWLPLSLCEKEAWQYAVYFATAVFCAVLIFVQAKGEKKAVLITEFDADKKSYFRLISCLPLLAIVIYALILFAVNTFSVVICLILCFAFLLLYLLILWLQAEISRRVSAEYLNGAMNQWQQESRDYMNTIRSQRHDFNLHLHAVSGLINSGEYKQCGQYVQKLVSEANDVNDIMPVSDAVVGSMLYNMREEARRHGSDIIYHITYDMEDILCNGFECNKIIGNLLQNAIDALQSDDDKEYGIRLSIFKRGGNTVIISENRFSGDPDRIARVFEPGYSTKSGHEGIGLSMVLRTAERYGGRVYPEFAEEKIRFIVNIPNKVHLQGEEENK